MHLDRLSHRRFEQFFRDFYGDEKIVLPQIHIYSHRGSKLVTSILKVNGITIGRHVFIQPKLTWRDSEHRLCASKELIAHELTHAVQYSRQGFFGFLITYLGSYYKLLRKSKQWNFNARMNAYLHIPQEIEARRAAQMFMSENKNGE